MSEMARVEPKMTPLRHLARFSLITIFKTILMAVDYEVEGAERVPKKGPLLVVTNHLGLLDAPLILANFPRALDAVVLDSVLESPFLGQMLKWYGVIPVKRDRFDRNVIKQSIAALRSGRAIGIAPEAGVSETESLRKARDGAAYLAVKAGVPILPIAVTGTETVHGIWDHVAQKTSFVGIENLAFWNRNREKPSLRMVIGNPFNLDELSQNWRDRREALRGTTDVIMRQIAALLPEQYRGVYLSDSSPSE